MLAKKIASRFDDPGPEVNREASPETGGEFSKKPPGGLIRGTFAAYLQTLWQDIRYSARILYKRPAFTLIAVLTLALGIGANTAIFSVVNASLLTPIAVPEPERVVMVWTDKVSRGSAGFPASVPDFLDWQASGVFEHLAGFSTDGFNLLPGNQPRRVQGAEVTKEWFEILELRPYLGRLFRSEDMQPGHDKVVLLSHGLWSSLFRGDPTIVGKSTIINSTPYTVIGVLPKKISRAADEELYVPLVFDPPLAAERGLRWVATVGRLAPNKTLPAAQHQMTALSRRLADQYPNEDVGNRARLQPIEEAYVEDIHTLVLVLFGAVGFVLLIACANIANLLLVRGTARQKEMAVRAALGAGKLRLTAQLLTENVILSSFGGLAAIVPAFLGIRLLLTFKPEALPNAELIRLNPAVLLFTLALALCTGLLFGLVPAWQAWRTDVSCPLRERAHASGPELRFGNLLVIGEVALTLILVAGAALMLRSFLRLRSANPGYDLQHVLTMRISLSGKQYETPEKQILFYKELLRELGELPGVRRAGTIDCLPTSNDVTGGTLHFTDRPDPKESESAIVVIGSASPDFFETMRIPRIRGRVFSESDGPDSLPTVVVDEATARRYWPNQDPIGKFVRLRLRSPLRKIIGVVASIDRSVAVKLKSRIGQVYVPFAQSPAPEMSVVISSEQDPTSLIAAVRHVVSRLAPDQPVFQFQTMEEARASGQLSSRFGTWLLGFFALLSLLLAAVGIYGVISYTVEQRSREIGLRMAMGATPLDILFAAIKKGFFLTFIGLIVGVAGALVLTRVMGTLLQGISAIDPASFGAAAVILITVGLFATYIPAWRAGRVQPMIALRHE
jgi:putative ABC transport system permease protein